MKRIATIFGLGLVGLMVIIYFDNRQVIGQATHRAADAAVDWLIVVLWTVLVVGVVAVFGLLYLAYLRGPHNERNRMRDGSHELQRHRIRRAWWDVFGWFTGVTVIIDPNLMESAVAYIGNDGYIEGPAIREPVRIEVQRTRHIGAMYPGDGVLGTSRVPVMQPKPASMKSIAATPAKPSTSAMPQLPGPVTPVTPDAPRYDLLDALTKSTADRWIVGQSIDGKLAAFNPRAHAHVGVIGATGTGKTTSVGFALALQALSQRYHVVILDPPGGEDWSRFGRHAEYHETDSATFPAHVDALYRLFEQRTDGANVQPVFAVVEEYGDMIRHLRKANRADADAVDVMLDTLLSRGRKRGVHLCFIDQYPEYWSQQVIGGTKFRAVFQLGPNQGAKVEEYKAAQLPDVGAFLVRGDEYRSWDAKAEAADLLSVVPVRKGPHIIDGTATVVRSFGAPVGGGSTSGSEPTELAPNRTIEPEETDAQRQAKAMIDANAETRQVDLVNALGISKVYASELWHRYHPAGKNYEADEPPAPQRTDAAGRPQTIIDASDPANAAALAEIRAAIEAGQANIKPRR